MPRHRLAALFEPQSVLVVADRHLAASDRNGNAADTRGSSIVTVNVLADQPIQLPDAWSDAAGPARLDQVLICVPPKRLPEVLETVRVCRPRSVVLLPHEEPSDNPLEEMVYCRSWGTLNDCAVLGPRSFGVQRPHLGLNHSHERQMPLAGRVALVAQSRSITAAVLDWAEDVTLGFSTVVSLGDECVVDVADVLDFLAMDPRTDGIALYLEETTSSRRFTSALRAAAAIKPVVVLKVGHNAEAAKAEDAVFNALLRRAGAVRIRYFVQLFSALKVLVHTRRPRGRKVAVFSNGNGAAQLALDVMGDNESVFRAELSQATLKALAECMEPGGGVGNPAVTHAPVTAQRAQAAIETLAEDPGVDGVLVVLTPDPLADLGSVAERLATLTPAARKPIVTCLMGEADMRGLRHVLDSVGTPAFRTPESAANAFGILGSYHYNQTLSEQTLPPEPLSRPPRLERARQLVSGAQKERRTSLSAAETEELLQCFHLPLRYLADPGGAAPSSPEESLPMSIRIHRDAKFGPYMLFGSGGQDAVLGNAYQAVELPPLNSYLARKFVQRSPLWHRALSKQLTPAVFEDLLEVLERLSELVSELPGVHSLVIDPLFADDMQLIAHSLVIELGSESMLVLPETSGYRHMAIHPYPHRLVQAKVFTDGQPWMLRPIRPEDAQHLQEFVRGLSDESRYMRFVSMLRELTPRMLARYTRIDYDRELALIATVQVPNPANRGHPREQIIGFAHYLRNADGRGAEYALVIGDAWQRRGLGRELMTALINAAQEQGLTYIDGMVLSNNRPMLALMTGLGFENDRDEEDPSMRRVWLDLGETRRY